MKGKGEEIMYKGEAAFGPMH